MKSLWILILTLTLVGCQNGNDNQDDGGAPKPPYEKPTEEQMGTAREVLNSTANVFIAGQTFKGTSKGSFQPFGTLAHLLNSTDSSLMSKSNRQEVVDIQSVIDDEHCEIKLPDELDPPIGLMTSKESLMALTAMSSDKAWVIEIGGPNCPLELRAKIHKKMATQESISIDVELSYLSKTEEMKQKSDITEARLEGVLAVQFKQKPRQSDRDPVEIEITSKLNLAGKAQSQRHGEFALGHRNDTFMRLKMSQGPQDGPSSFENRNVGDANITTEITVKGNGFEGVFKSVLISKDNVLSEAYYVNGEAISREKFNEIVGDLPDLSSGGSSGRDHNVQCDVALFDSQSWPVEKIEEVIRDGKSSQLFPRARTRVCESRKDRKIYDGILDKWISFRAIYYSDYVLGTLTSDYGTLELAAEYEFPTDVVKPFGVYSVRWTCQKVEKCDEMSTNQ